MSIEKNMTQEEAKKVLKGSVVYNQYTENGQVVFDLTDHNSRANAPVNSSLNDNSENINTIVKPIQIESGVVPNFENISDLKIWIQNNLNLLGNVEIKDTKRTVRFSKTNIGRSMKGINRSDVKRNSYAGLKELVENAIYSYTKEVDERHSKKNNGQEIYHNLFIYNNVPYGIEISIDIPKNIKSTHTYAGHKVKVIEIAPEINGTKLPDLTGANISINDIRKLFNPDIKTYEQSAYHGTPHRFDKFSTKHIGTGETLCEYFGRFNKVKRWAMFHTVDNFQKTCKWGKQK